MFMARVGSPHSVVPNGNGEIAWTQHNSFSEPPHFLDHSVEDKMQKNNRQSGLGVGAHWHCSPKRAEVTHLINLTVHSWKSV